MVQTYEPDQNGRQLDVDVKNYILDTNVLLHDPNSILSFQENHVLIPIEVIEEIDRFKRESSELGGKNGGYGYAARIPLGLLPRKLRRSCLCGAHAHQHRHR